APAPPAAPGVVSASGPVTSSGIGVWVEVRQPGVYTFQVRHADPASLLVYAGDQGGNWVLCTPPDPVNGVGSATLLPGQRYVMVVDQQSRGSQGDLHVWTTPTALTAAA
ncbi:MAG: hypothetical protein H7123_09850, partial [Thermoleophilia bacterium]|nr:hypothetical protein [Thermoleophilia bacterium]